MATTATSGLISLSVPTLQPSQASMEGAVTSRRRKISPEAGRAIEMLGHAIEYLADEFALDCMGGATKRGSGIHPRLAAIEVLMEKNREIYFSCPVVPPFAFRFRGLLGLIRG